MSTEMISGEGPYRVTFHEGVVVLVELWRDDTRMTVGKPGFDGRCARCGAPIKVFTPDNDTMEVCEDCRIALAAAEVAG